MSNIDSGSMSKIPWTELNIPLAGSPALELSLGTEAASKARQAGEPLFGIIKRHKGGWSLSVIVDGLYLLRPAVFEELREGAEALVLQMGSELDIIEEEERNQGNGGRAFSGSPRSFRIIVPDRLRDTAIEMIEDCFDQPADAVIPVESLT
jgi:hypothetical protein